MMANYGKKIIGFASWVVSLSHSPFGSLGSCRTLPNKRFVFGPGIFLTESAEWCLPSSTKEINTTAASSKETATTKYMITWNQINYWQRLFSRFVISFDRKINLNSSSILSSFLIVTATTSSVNYRETKKIRPLFIGPGGSVTFNVRAKQTGRKSVRHFVFICLQSTLGTTTSQILLALDDQLIMVVTNLIYRFNQA